MNRRTIDSLDNRKVQTVVICTAGSDKPALLPQEGDTAAQFRRRHRHGNGSSGSPDRCDGGPLERRPSRQVPVPAGLHGHGDRETGAEAVL